MGTVAMAQAVLQGLHELEGSTSDGKNEAGALKINVELDSPSHSNKSRRHHHKSQSHTRQQFVFILATSFIFVIFLIFIILYQTPVSALYWYAILGALVLSA